MSFAVIRTGGKQYRVSAGSVLTVEKLPGEPGDAVDLGDVLLCGDSEGIEVGQPTVKGASVKGVIVRQGRGPRIDVFKKKRRKNYRRHYGHRQWETTIRVTELAGVPIQDQEGPATAG